jgi:hypothetical protein
VNLHALPALDEAPVAGDDVVSRVLADARLVDEPALLDALEARRVELGLSNKTCELVAGLCDGHLTKVCGPSRERSPTLATLDRLMTVLGLSWVLVVDPSKVDRVQAQWRPRDASHVRQRALSPITIARARPHVLAELSRTASRSRWAGVDARTFIKALAREEIT